MRATAVTFVLSTLLALLGQAHAGVVILGTRVIYPSTARDVSIRLMNRGDQPGLVQAWVDNGDATASPDDVDAPFTVMPVVVRIDPAKTQVLRLIRTGGEFPGDRESLYWLNVLEIPPQPQGEEADRNVLQFAVRSRLKILYRPTQLGDKAADAWPQLRWRVEAAPSGARLVVSNPSAFYVNFADVQLRSAQGEPLAAKEARPGMVAPFGTTQWEIAEVPPQAVARIVFSAINDQGAVLPVEAGLDGAASAAPAASAVSAAPAETR